MTEFLQKAASVDSQDEGKIIHEAIIPIKKSIPKRFEG